MSIPKKRITSAKDIRRVLSERINLLREIGANIDKQIMDKEKRIKLKIEISRTIAYISSVQLTSISNVEVEERFKALEEKLKNAESQ